MFTGQKLFDLSFLEEMDDQNFIVEVLTVYLEDTRTDLDEMDQAFKTGDLDTVQGNAHKLKSSTGMLQANTLFSILEQLESMAKAGEVGDKPARLLQMGMQEFDRLKAALELHLRTIQMIA